MTREKVGSLLVLTEDGAPTAHATIVAVVKRMLQLVDPAYQTHRIGFEPKDEQAQKAIQGSRWKDDSPRHHAERTLALRTIATKLAREDGFVFFHIDGDRAWPKRATSENAAKFETMVVARVRQILQRPGTKSEDIDRRLGRLFPVIPFYSIEAWLFQHTVLGIRLCREHHDGSHVALFEAWAKDRTKLDDVERPKEQVCLKSAHNKDCAGAGFPAQEVFDAGRSYAACVERLRASGELVALLAATTAWQ